VSRDYVHQTYKYGLIEIHEVSVRVPDSISGIKLLWSIVDAREPAVLRLPAVVEGDGVAVPRSMVTESLVEKALREAMAASASTPVLVPPVVDVLVHLKKGPALAVRRSVQRACRIRGIGLPCSCCGRSATGRS